MWSLAAVVLAAVLLSGCVETRYRRPTAEELAGWDSHADRVVAYTVLWEVGAMAALAFFVVDLVRRQRREPPPWSLAVTILAGVVAVLMLLPTFLFVPLWGA